MHKPVKVKWTRKSLSNAIGIKKYILTKFSKKEVLKFEQSLKEFEITISNFPTLYPESKAKKAIRRAVIHKNTATVIAMKDNRQKKPS
ncbi:hypothetical protein [Maribacter sp. 2304DJ31-5]|uniref:hypothetical protein n=1 Tax=Maribacter sp. 2304DJ31-5 TaxID=3386273 RepID=UPI0039BCD471